MKKLPLTLALLVASTLSAQATPTIYGRIYTGFNYEEDGRVELSTNASRLGFKGSEALNDTLDVTYQLEYGIKPDAQTDKEAVFTPRDTYLGIKHKQFGELRFGRQYTPDDEVRKGAPTDYFNGIWQDGDFGARLNDSVKYISPTVNGVTLYAQVKIEDDKDVKSTNAKGELLYNAQGRQIYNKVTEKGSYFLALDYQSETLPLAVGLSYNDYKSDDNNRDTKSHFVDNSFAITAEYKVMDEKLDLSAGYQHKKLADESLADLDAYIVSANYHFTPKFNSYVEYDFSKNVDGIKGKKLNTLSTGVWYQKTKSFATWAGVGYTNGDDRDSKYGVTTGIKYVF